MHIAYELAVARNQSDATPPWYHKPKYFAKFDMTKGYWQIALGEKFQLATAFITVFGIFMWKRIPIGIQPAASYFQYCMMVIVLAGLAYDI